MVRLVKVYVCDFQPLFVRGVPDMERLADYLRIKEAAEYLGVSPNTLRNWGRDGRIVEHRHPVNNYRLYKKVDLTRLLRRAEASSC